MVELMGENATTTQNQRGMVLEVCQERLPPPPGAAAASATKCRLRDGSY